MTVVKVLFRFYGTLVHVHVLAQVQCLEGTPFCHPMHTAILLVVRQVGVQMEHPYEPLIILTRSPAGTPQRAILSTVSQALFEAVFLLDRADSPPERLSSWGARHLRFMRVAILVVTGINSKIGFSMAMCPLNAVLLNWGWLTIGAARLAAEQFIRSAPLRTRYCM